MTLLRSINIYTIIFVCRHALTLSSKTLPHLLVSHVPVRASYAHRLVLALVLHALLATYAWVHLVLKTVLLFTMLTFRLRLANSAKRHAAIVILKLNANPAKALFTCTENDVYPSAIQE